MSYLFGSPLRVLHSFIFRTICSLDFGFIMHLYSILFGAVLLLAGWLLLMCVRLTFAPNCA